MTRRRLPVVFTRRAARQIEDASHWWQANRPAAPDAIAEELSDALHLVASQPGTGTVAELASLAGVRRVFLARIGYFVYYRVRRRRDEIEVVGFWHARRGAPPEFRGR